MPHALREAFSAYRRTPLLVFLSVLAVGLSLFVIGLFALTYWIWTKGVNSYTGTGS